MLKQDTVDCPRLVELLDSLTLAPRYNELNQILWNRRGPDLGGQLWTYKDAYTAGLDPFQKGSEFPAIKDAMRAQ